MAILFIYFAYLLFYFQVICICLTLRQTQAGALPVDFFPWLLTPSFCWRALQRPYVEKCFQCFSGGGCTFKKVTFQRRQTSIHPSEHSLNKTTWACIYSSVPPTSVLILFSRNGFVSFFGRNVKDHYNVLVSDRGRGPSPNLSLILGVTGLCLTETSLHVGALADSLFLCAPLEAHLLRDSPISTAIKRINSSILGLVEME